MEALVYFTLSAGLIFLMMRFGCGAHVMGHGHGKHGAGDKDAPRNFEQLRWVVLSENVIRFGFAS